MLDLTDKTIQLEKITYPGGVLLFPGGLLCHREEQRQEGEGASGARNYSEK